MQLLGGVFWHRLRLIAIGGLIAAAACDHPVPAHEVVTEPPPKTPPESLPPQRPPQLTFVFDGNGADSVLAGDTDFVFVGIEIHDSVGGPSPVSLAGVAVVFSLTDSTGVSIGPTTGFITR